MFAIGPIIGAVRENRINILFEVTSIAVAQVSITSGNYNDYNAIVARPGSPTIYEHIGLVDNARYEIEISTELDTIRGSFITGDGEIHILSCNNQDSNTSTLEAMSRDTPSLCIHIGDQVYGDKTYKKARKMNSYESMLNLYRQMYRDIWSRDVMKNILSSRCNAMIMDDHDITDSWDQLIRIPHSWRSIVHEEGWELLAYRYKKKRHKAIIAGLQAYSEYQLPLSGQEDPGSFSLSIGNRDILLLDVRMIRATRSPVLDINPYMPYDIVVSPVPVFLLPRIVLNSISTYMLRLLKIRDPSDSWNLYPEHMEQVMYILSIDNSLLVCGDSHMCGYTTIDSNYLQLVTSGIATKPAPSIIWYTLRMFRKYRIRRRSIEHIHWTRYNNYLSLSPNGDNRFIIPDI